MWELNLDFGIKLAFYHSYIHRQKILQVMSAPQIDMSKPLLTAIAFKETV